MRKLTYMLAITTTLLSACSSGEEGKEKAFLTPLKDEKIDHIHGAGYPGNDEGLYIATHHGVKIYRNGKWYETIENNHDYMGFQATKEGFYSSGHPEEGSNLKNPLGLVKSTDKGKKLKKVAFYGESDFHYLATGYNSPAIYVVNSQPNSKIGQGLYFSEDKGETWNLSQLNGMPQTPANSIAAHPEEVGTIGIATQQGLYLSKDKGNNFKLFSQVQNVTALSINKESVIYSTLSNQKSALISKPLNGKEAEEEIAIPSLDKDDTILFINVNPFNPSKMSFITKGNDIYLTENGGRKWNKTLEDGKITKS
ncbi:F510_1955 family glycosylhydrolase [Priestia megaterium]|uniref:F510_1955 family glycosylhydrolase n=1 Tax=Priestia megaterium TaxID=1404 RepID=UPI0007623432|nr:hypothetical protein [Priestia megaterium]KWU60996.1 hypothetical protein AWX17_19410 [Priestia megaterium]